MYVDTSLMRTPFIKIRVGPPMDNKGDTTLIDLPPHVAGLLSTFEYNQVIDGGDGAIGQVTLNFVEGNFNDSGTGMGKVGYDNPGSLLDLMLNINSSEPIKYVDPEEIAKSRTEVEASIAKEDDKLLSPKILDGSSLDALHRNAEETLQSVNSKNADSIFLFQENNVVEITWGYVEADGGTEPLLESNTVTGQMIRIIHRAHESDMPVLEVFIIDYGTGEFSKYRPSTAINFDRGTCAKRLQLAGLKMVDTRSYEGQSAFEPATTDDVVRTIATIVPNCEGVVILTDEERQLDLQQKGSGRVWSTGMTLNEFLRDLAKKLDAHYWVSSRLDNKTGKLIHKINVVSRRQQESRVSYRFIWKGGDTFSPYIIKRFNTVKSLTLSLFPEGGQGGSSSGIDTEKKLMVGDSKQVQVAVVAYSEEKKQSIESTKTIMAWDATSLHGAGKYGESSEISDHKATVKMYANKMSRALRLDFITLGIPLLRPSTISMSNIGRRYSGEYYALSVAHRISASDGYICTVMANTNAIAKGGVINKDSLVQEAVLPDKVVTLVSEDGTPDDVESTAVDKNTPVQGGETGATQKITEEEKSNFPGYEDFHGEQ
jgi:hypothetical protein